MMNPCALIPTKIIRDQTNHSTILSKQSSCLKYLNPVRRKISNIFYEQNPKSKITISYKFKHCNCWNSHREDKCVAQISE